MFFEKVHNKIFELRLKSSGMLYLVELSITVDVSKEHNAFFLSVRCSGKGAATLFGFFDNDEKGLTFLRNVTDRLIVDMT